MHSQVFINIPVKSLDRSVDFFTRLGYRFRQDFTDATGTCMIISDDIFVMLLTEPKFKSFTPKEVCDATKNTEVLICLRCNSKAEVDNLVQKAIEAGGSIYSEPQDHGFMYGHGYQDPDGHVWELVYLEPASATGG